MRANGLVKNDAGLRRRKKKERSSDKEMDGGNTHDVRDGPDGAEGCGGRSRIVEKNDHDGQFNESMAQGDKMSIGYSCSLVTLFCNKDQLASPSSFIQAWDWHCRS